MNWFEKFIVAISPKMTTPTTFGWFHIVSILVVILATVLLVYFARKANDKQNRIILITVSTIMILFEVYKQLVYSYTAAGGWHYQWYAFPFQFCSVPMYVAFIAALIKPGRVQQAMFNFLATFGLLAGLLVMIIPGDVFTSAIGVNIQSMMHHGLMVVMGVYLLASGRVKLKHKTILSASVVFGIILSMAMAANLITHWCGLDLFNLFYISPYGKNHLPILSIIQASAPYFVFLLSYVVGFILSAYIILLIAMGIGKIFEIIEIKKEEKRNIGKPHYKHNTRM